MKFSLIVPAYNVENVIIDCLKSIWSQDLAIEDYEVIIVDDGSTDNTYKVTKKFVDDKKNATLLTQKNQRQGAARNNALKIAKGEYIWFIDSDDYIEKNVLSVLYEIAIQKRLDLLCFTNYRVLNNSITENKLNLKKISFETTYSGKDIINAKSIYCGPCFCIYKKQFLDKCNLRFKEGVFYEDNEFMLRVYYFAQKVYYLNVPLYYVVLTEKSATRQATPIPIFDLLKVVNSMLDFTESIKKDSLTKQNCYYYTAMAFNTAISKLRIQPKNIQKRFLKKAAIQKKEIIRAMLKSKDLRYNLEGIAIFISLKFYFKVFSKIR